MSMRGILKAFVLAGCISLSACDRITIGSKAVLTKELTSSKLEAPKLQEGEFTPSMGMKILRYLQLSSKNHRNLDLKNESPCEWGGVFVLQKDGINFSVRPMPSEGVTKLFVEFDGRTRECSFVYDPTDDFNAMITYGEKGVIIYDPNVLESHLNFLFGQK